MRQDLFPEMLRKEKNKMRLFTDHLDSSLPSQLGERRCVGDAAEMGWGGETMVRM